jgi:hypothetical protein
MARHYVGAGIPAQAQAHNRRGRQGEGNSAMALQGQIA